MMIDMSSPRGDEPSSINAERRIPDTWAASPSPDGTLAPAVLRVLIENRDRFLGFLSRRVGSRDLAEEILQDAFVRGIARGGGLRRDESAVAWFYRLLHRALVDRVRRQASEKRGLTAFAQEVSAHQDGPAPDQELAKTVCACVGALLPTLRPDYADALARVEMAGEPLPTFAAARGISRGNAGVRLFRARQALRKRVQESCGACASDGCQDCQCPAPQPREAP